MPITLTREYRFEAAHHLPGHRGKCARMHGHSYRVQISVAGTVGTDGMIMDFEDVDALVDPVLGSYDHHVLNDLLPNPTCELLAVDALTRMHAAGLPVTSLTVWETERGAVTVTADVLADRDMPEAGSRP